MRDVKAEVFGPPFFVPNDAIALRLLAQLVLDKRSDLGKYPGEFFLYHVGEFSVESGALAPISPVRMVCAASSCLPQPDPRQPELPGTEAK